MSQLVGGLLLDVMEVENDIDRDGQDQDQEWQDVDVDGESLRGHVTREELDPGEQSQRHDREDLGDLCGAEPQQERHTLDINFLIYFKFHTLEIIVVTETKIINKCIYI